MFIDANEFTEEQQIEADICVIGGGVAGITMAREWAHTNQRIVVLESGRFEIDSSTQALYQGEYLAHDLYDLQSSRLRFFGGTSNHWSGNCQIFPAEELKPRHWIAHSGWPVNSSELAPYYKRAAVICELPAGRFDGAYWARRLGFPLTSLDETRFIHEVLEKSPPTRFGSRYRSDLAKAKNVKVYLNTNLTDFTLAACGDRLSAVTAHTLDGQKLDISAKRFVLACGAVENARLLLNANAGCPQGIGNDHGLVGRYYMDHPIVLAGTLVTPTGTSNMEFYKRHSNEQGEAVRGLLRVSPLSQLQHKMASACIVVAPKSSRSWARSSLSALWKAAKQRRIHGLLGHQLSEAWEDSFKEDQDINTNYSAYSISVRAEQAPNRDSRITLTDERDELGLRRVRVDWRLTKFDRHTMDQALNLFAIEVGRLGIGRVHNELGNDPLWPDKMRGGPHHTGTTRMHDDPGQGVVDRNCKVHSMDNLYIAGSSLFPTSSSSMPTLTIVALALRLAEHLTQEEI